MKWPSTLLILACAVPAFATDTNDLLALVPPGATTIIGVHVKTTLNSTLARSITEQMHLTTRDLPQLVPVDGFDPLSDLDEVIFTTSGEDKDAPMLVVATGKFDLDRLTSKGKLYHGVRLIVTETKTETSGFAFVDASTVMMGDLMEIKAAIDQRVSKRARDEVRWAELAAYRDKYAIWGFAERPSTLVGRLPNYSATPVFGAVERMQFGVGLVKGLEIKAELHARSADDISQLADSLRLFETMMKTERPTLNDGNTSLGIETADNILRVSLAVSDEQLAKAIQNPKPAEVAVTASTEPVHKETAQRKVRTAPAPAEGGTSVFTLPGRR